MTLPASRSILTHRSITVALILGPLLLPACTLRQSAKPLALADGASLPIQASAKNQYSHAARSLRVHVLDRKTLAQFAVALPEIDFKRQMVLIAAAGPAPSDSCGIQITRVWREGDHLRVDIEQTYPPADEMHRPGASSPLHAVVVPRVNLPVANFSSQLPQRAFRWQQPS